MDFAQFGSEMTREQEMISTKKRLDSFRFNRSSGPIASAPLSPTSSVGRPHSRHGSVSSVSFSTSTSANSLLTTSAQSSIPSSDSRPSSLVGRPRPSSHHRRRSSVSTRVESAEMMGVNLPDLPSSSSDDNINFGDKDSVRRRALQALEGRNDLGSYNNIVEIPDFTSQGLLQKPSDRELKLPMSSPSFGIPSSLSGKRDSFGKFLSSASSLKDQLHTLMEEEEEEEENGIESTSAFDREPNSSSACEDKAGSPGLDMHHVSQRLPSRNLDIPDMSKTLVSVSSRHRPANLTLRPLSLIHSASNPSLPITSLTPNLRAGLRPFSLTPQPDSHLASGSESIDMKTANHVGKQTSDLHSTSSSISSSTSVSGSFPSTSPCPKRQSSISYIRSGSTQSQPTSFTFASLPTPGATPTSERRQSASSISSFGSPNGQDRRTASEDMFLHQSHASLLARIAELEHALLSRSRSRPSSMHSDSSADASHPPPDEMLQLVADLKSERDELNRDIDGWRQRVKDLEHTKTLLGHEKAVLERRLEAEKREAWLRDEKLSLLEMEKGTLSRQLKTKEEDLSSVSRRLESSQAQLRQAVLECRSLKEDAQVAKRQLAEAQALIEARKDTEAELARLREALAAEQNYRRNLIAQLDAAGILATPKATDDLATSNSSRMVNYNQSRGNGLGFQSVDSSCTTVDADEDSQQLLRAPFTLKAVEEETSSCSTSLSDDEDELARYEDEDDLDLSFASPTRSMSSANSDDDLPRSLAHLRLAANSTPVPSGFGNGLASSPRSLSSTPSPTTSPCPTPIPPLMPEVRSSEHVKNASLSKTWTFPRGGQATTPRPPHEEVDRFFECLEDVESQLSAARCSMDNRSIFSQRLQFNNVEDEDFPPFVLPAQKTVQDSVHSLLDVVLEEDEDILHFDAANSRRKPSFPISVTEDSSSRMASPIFEDHVHTNSVPFVFPQMKAQRSECKPAPVQSRNEHSDMNGFRVPDRPSVVAPPQSSVRRSAPPSRIPPPSPPMFIQAKTSGLGASPSPPKRKPVPAPTVNVVPASPSRIKPLGVAVGSPQRTKKPVPQLVHGSTFIPHLKNTSRLAHSSLSS
ncbi:uncharacterized protein FOMMEDRAFT_21703 [Fomitiporia mediterranea MF3/22]|uniref:uncharacterized protein n=1 Tax=Fomitiporia mediterranea (strain MF3/22) TaxID=694068 RepID=UPI0004407DD2|nr:uncharacterized protein FOMMEDRAFT_21703 [Fomitiporia mediterranea MF3/22]EJD01284.1 hypothetical protein FOMMEDRAFT_21703 [Fomitiporia mediterranea MF3/22]